MNNHFSPDQADLFEKILQARRDVRGHLFTDAPVADDVVERIIDSGLCAPSVGFSQPWRFVVIREKHIKQQVKDSYDAENETAAEQFDGEKGAHYRRLKLEGILEAPVNMAVYYVPSRAPVLGQATMKDMGEYSVVCAIQNMWLMARALNIGMGWVSILDPAKVSQILSAPRAYKLVGYLCFGYVTGFQDQPELELKGWETRKEKEGLVFREGFNSWE